jgi:hypothetical protein
VVMHNQNRICLPNEWEFLQKVEGFVMGVSVRVFLVDDNDSLQRIPMAKLDRLLHFDRIERLQRFAGNRKPLDFGTFYFHSRWDVCRKRHIIPKAFNTTQTVMWSWSNR